MKNPTIFDVDAKLKLVYNENCNKGNKNLFSFRKGYA